MVVNFERPKFVFESIRNGLKRTQFNFQLDRNTTFWLMTSQALHNRGLRAIFTYPVRSNNLLVEIMWVFYVYLMCLWFSWRCWKVQTILKCIFIVKVFQWLNWTYIGRSAITCILAESYTLYTLQMKWEKYYLDDLEILLTHIKYLHMIDVNILFTYT